MDGLIKKLKSRDTKTNIENLQMELDDISS